MARGKKKQNEELLQQAYYSVVKNYQLDQNAPVNDQVHSIIEHADALQDQICKNADYIKIDAYQRVKEDYAELGIPKGVWLELVNVRRLQRHTTLTDDVIAKITASFDGAKNVTALRMTLLDAIEHNNVDNVAVPTVDTEKSFTYGQGEPLAPEFIDLLDECADIRHEIDSKMWTQMRILGDAFSYLTKEPYAVFKHLLDLWHYRNGGWPKDTTPPRIWSSIARFIHDYDLLNQYGFDMAKSWCKRFGLQTSRTLPSPTLHMFNEGGERFGKYTMYKLKPDTEGNYPQYDFKPWLHLIISDSGVGFAYVWDTREIQFSFDSKVLNVIDLTTDYNDNCEPLVVAASTELGQLAAAEIPDVLQVNWKTQEAKQAEHTVVKPISSTSFAETFSAAKEALKAKLINNANDSELAQLIIGTDMTERYEWLKQHPEYRFSEDYDTKWSNGDDCLHECLGRGYVVGANEETGELICHFYALDKDIPVWMWQMTKVEPASTDDNGTSN
jgi:hypothetical protein